MNLNPFSGLSQLKHVPAFLRQLSADLKFLLRPDLPHDFTGPKREHFATDAAYLAAVRTLRYEYKLAVVREAVLKCHIRATLWRRFIICFFLPGPITVAFGLLVVLVWTVCLLENPAILNWFSLTWWWGEFAWWLKHVSVLT